MLRTLARFVWYALTPIPRVYDGVEVVVITAALLGMALGTPTWFTTWYENNRWAVVVGAIALLFAVAGIRLYAENARITGIPTIALEMVGRVVEASPETWKMFHKVPTPLYEALITVTNNGDAADFWAEASWADLPHPRWTLGWASYSHMRHLNQREDADLLVFVVESFRPVDEPATDPKIVHGEAHPISDVGDLGHVVELRANQPLVLVVRVHAVRDGQTGFRDYEFDVGLNGKLVRQEAVSS